MHGDQALQLVTAAQRSTLATAPQLPLPKYAQKLVLDICLETRQLGDAIAHMTESAANLSQDQALICALTIKHLAVRRNKRCLLAYLHTRVGGIKERWWDAGGALAHLLAPYDPTAAPGVGNSTGDPDAPDLRSALSQQELDFMRDYSSLVLDYKSDFLDVLDVAAPIGRPPGELFVDVRVVRDAGEVVLENGARFEFTKGSRFYLERALIERLIVQGYLEEM
jgi:GINS complex subunit 1